MGEVDAAMQNPASGWLLVHVLCTGLDTCTGWPTETRASERRDFFADKNGLAWHGMARKGRQVGKVDNTP